jgi:hypothetical protein
LLATQDRGHVDGALLLPMKHVNQGVNGQLLVLLVGFKLKFESHVPIGVL